MLLDFSTRLSGSKSPLLVLLASSVVFAAGCAYTSHVATPDNNPISSPATLTGKVHGGNQPVTGATVTLWFSGQGGTTPLPPTKAATTTTDAQGFFSFVRDATGGTHDGTTNTYACPAGVASPLVYVLSQGGNTQNNGVVGQTNTAAGFIGLYGSCDELSAANFVFLSEATTVATMAAAQQFFDPRTETISSSGTDQQRRIMLNLPNTVKLMADPATGLAVSSTSIPATGGGDIPQAVSLLATPETGKINLMADILSSCINQTTAATPTCGTLSAAAVPPIPSTTSLNPATPFPAATDTLQAAYYMLTNPTDGSATNLATLFGLAPGIGAPFQPTSVLPTDWTIGIFYTSSADCTAAHTFMGFPAEINIDAQDNVWFANRIGGNLSAISASGAPFACVFEEDNSPQGGAHIDVANNVWYLGTTTMYRYNPATRTSLSFPVGVAPFGMTVDGVGNVYFSATDTIRGSVYMLPGAATATAPVAPIQISSTVGAGPSRLMSDGTSASPRTIPGNIWVSSNSSFVSQLSHSNAPGNLNGWITTPFTTLGNSRGVSIDSANNVFVSATNSISALAHSGASWASANGFPFAQLTAGISGPGSISVDGRSNIWIPNFGQPSISEISFPQPTALSPATGFAKDTTLFLGNQALAVDQAGNIWTVGVNNVVSEIVGAGVPLYQPYAVGISNGHFQSIP
jgi:hypothetical protein